MDNDKLASHHLINSIERGITNVPKSNTNAIRTYNHIKLTHVLIKKALSAFADKSAVEEVLNLSYQCDLIVKLVHKNERAKALMRIEEINMIIENEFSEELYLYAKQELLSAKALHCYKTKKLDMAHKLSLEGVAINEYLVRRGCFVLIHRCTELNVNLSKVLVKKGRYEEGVKIHGGVLGYLADGKVDDLHGTIFNEKKYWTPFPCLREDFMLDNFKSMCFFLIDHKRYRGGGEKVLFDCLFSQVYDLESDTYLRKILRDWIDIKRKFFSKEYDLFVTKAVSFLQNPIEQYFDILKLSLCQNLITLVQGAPDEARILTKIEGYIDTKLMIDRKYKEKVIETIQAVY